MKVTIELEDDWAVSFAQFMKRVGYEDYRKLAKNSEEAYEMFYASEKIRDAFATQGFAPR